MGQGPSLEQIEQERLLRREKRDARIAASKRRHKLAQRLTFAAGAFSFIATIGLIHYTRLLEPAHVPTPPAALVSTQPNRVQRVAATDPDRPNFRYSIVAGGVRSKE